MTPEREKEIRESLCAGFCLSECNVIKELLTEIDRLRDVAKGRDETNTQLSTELMQLTAENEQLRRDNQWLRKTFRGEK